MSYYGGYNDRPPLPPNQPQRNRSGSMGYQGYQTANNNRGFENRENYSYNQYQNEYNDYNRGPPDYYQNSRGPTQRSYSEHDDRRYHEIPPPRPPSRGGFSRQRGRFREHQSKI